jgi:putative ABC transport system ATP-binding protein
MKGRAKVKDESF